MSQVTLRPNGVIAQGGATASSGTIASVLADDSDSTYNTLAKGGAASIVSLGTTTKPAGSKLKSVQLRARYASETANPTRLTAQVRLNKAQWSKLGGVWHKGTGIEDVSAPATFTADLTQAHIDDLRVAFACPSTAWDPCRLYEIYVDVVFQEKPSVTVDALGTVTTSDVTSTTTYTPGMDGGPQTRIRWKLFTAAQVATSGFDPATSPGLLDTGGIAGQQSEYTFRGLGEGSYRQYVWVAQAYGSSGYHVSDPVYDDFIVDLTTAEVSDVSVALINDQGAFEGIVDFDPSADDPVGVEIERSSLGDLLDGAGAFASGSGGVADGWATFTGGSVSVTPTIESSGGVDGGPFQQLAFSSLGGGVLAGLEALEPKQVEPNADHLLRWALRGSHGSSNVFTSVFLDWLDAAENVISTSSITYGSGQPYGMSDTQWNWWELSARSPENAALARVRVGSINGTGSTTATIKLDAMTLTAFDGAWERVRGDTLLVPVNDQVTFIDWEAPPGIKVRYRARAINENGVVGAWVYSTDAPQWDMTRGVWVKSLWRPERSALFELGAPPVLRRRQRRGVHDVIGEAMPVVTSDVRSGRDGTLVIRTYDEAEAEALALLAEEDVVLIHAPSEVRLAAGYWSLGDMVESHLTQTGAFPYRDFEFNAVEVARP